jgi:hypothetical protein
VSTAQAVGVVHVLLLHVLLLHVLLLHVLLLHVLLLHVLSQVKWGAGNDEFFSNGIDGFGDVDNHWVEGTAISQLRYNRFLLYDMRRLHNVFFNQSEYHRVTGDAAKGRLTTNSFFWMGGGEFEECVHLSSEVLRVQCVCSACAVCVCSACAVRVQCVCSACAVRVQCVWAVRVQCVWAVRVRVQCGCRVGVQCVCSVWVQCVGAVCGCSMVCAV